MKRTSWSAGLSVSADGVGVVAHAGSVGLRLLADRTGLTGELSKAMVRRSFTPVHDRGRVLVDVSVMLADGGEAIADIDVLRHQAPVLGRVASPPTVWRTLDEVTAGRLKKIATARARARRHVWAQLPGGLPASSYVGDDPVDATDPSGEYAQIIFGCLIGAGASSGTSYLIGRKHGKAALIGTAVGGCALGAGEGFAIGMVLDDAALFARLMSEANDLRTGGVVARTLDDVLSTPQVSSTKLQNLIDNLNKGTTKPKRLGDGTTMDAIRNEIATGVPTSGRMHTIKGRETLRGLNNWLRRNPDADYYDRLVAQSLADELSLVLRGAQ